MAFRPTHTIGPIFLFALPVFGQGMFGQGINMMSSNWGTDRNGVIRGSATFNVNSRPLSAPKNAPYSGQEVGESKQTLVDGTNIIRQMLRGGKTWRDSQGRVRTEGNRMGGGMLTSEGDPVTVQISDPVAGYMYVLDNVNHVAHRVPIGAAAANERPAPMARPAGVTGTPATAGGLVSGGVIGGIIGPLPAAPGRTNRPRSEITTEDLGTKMMDGVLVSGTRRTIIIPEGAQGNDRPMKTTHETWMSKELQLTLLSVDYSPMNGTTTTRIENFSSVEPDPALFMVPSNYSIVDEKETFTIKWGEQ